MGWSMDRQGIRTLFDRVTGRLKQFELSGPRRERVSLDTYSDELAARDAASEVRLNVRPLTKQTFSNNADRLPPLPSAAFRYFFSAIHYPSPTFNR